MESDKELQRRNRAFRTAYSHFRKKEKMAQGKAYEEALRRAKLDISELDERSKFITTRSENVN